MVDALYIHIPFCLKKCGYCDFHSITGKLNEENKYIDYLIKELSLYREYEYDTVYFGGGTPSLLNPKELKRLLDKIKFKEEAEITLELNPATVDRERLQEFKDIGINRLSIGVQSFNDNTLKILGRLHSSQKAKETFYQARDIGFENISIDLMFAVPNETLEDLKYDLDTIKLLDPEHISIYSLIWEEDTKFWELKRKGTLLPCDEDLEADMYEFIIKYLKNTGYKHYEISNFSKINYEARHNSKYWENKEYIALGLGASYYYQGCRGRNYLSFEDYYGAIDRGHRPIMEEEYIEDANEYKYILGLRLLNRGISIEKQDGDIRLICEKLVEKAYLYKKGKRYFLSDKGIFYANDVFEELIE